MKLKFDFEIIFVENHLLMGVRKGEKSGSDLPPSLLSRSLAATQYLNHEAISV